MKTKIILTMLLLVAITGCSSIIHPDLPMADDSMATEQGVKNTIAANNQFALEFYNRMNEKGKNLFFSPWSLEAAFAMTYEGAKGDTAVEMQKVLHFPSDPSVRLPSFAKLYNLINTEQKDYTLRTANALWAQKEYPFLPDYLSKVETYYAGKTTNIDFVGDTENSRQTINNWVEGQTNNKIKDLIPIGVIKPITRLVLTNAIYFKADWVKKFKKKDTQEADFKLSSGGTTNVQMMALREEKHNYAETDDLQILELPYKGEQISMLIILPREGKMSEVEESLTPQRLESLGNMMQKREIDIYLPKFKFETKYFLKQTLSDMGMPVAFSRGANFSGMDGTPNLVIGEVIHQAFVEVDEEGTEAAAATAVIMQLKSAMPHYFRADHPFIFIIQEKTTGGIIFMGKMENPTAS